MYLHKPSRVSHQTIASSHQSGRRFSVRSRIASGLRTVAIFQACCLRSGVCLFPGKEATLWGVGLHSCKSQRIKISMLAGFHLLSKPSSRLQELVPIPFKEVTHRHPRLTFCFLSPHSFYVCGIFCWSATKGRPFQHMFQIQVEDMNCTFPA